MKFLVTGCAGFIGFHIARKLIRDGHKVIGIDNLNSYYDLKLKKDRLNNLKSIDPKKFIFHKLDISEESAFNKISKYKVNIIVHLAAQAGVRYSLKHPKEYIKSNLNGFFNILSYSKKNKITKIIFASSSSVYGKTRKKIFHENLRIDRPLQLYAATKASNELMAASYHHLYNINFIGLRFFTVYGEWGRPDMAIYTFTKNIIENKPVLLFNNGNNFRDFTYIDDAVAAINNSINYIKKQKKIFEIFNVGNNKNINVKEYLKVIELNLGKKANIIKVPHQPGDMVSTRASTYKSKKNLKFSSKYNLQVGIKNYVNWFKDYYKKKNK